MRLAIYERLYQFNFHLIEARRTLEELGLALRMDDVEEFRGIRWELDETRREGNRQCCSQMEALEAREKDELYPRELDPDEAVVRESQSCESQSHQSGGREPREPNLRNSKDNENPRRPR